MKKHLFALLALVLFVAGCPSNAPQVDASDFAPLDAAVEAGHRVGSFNPTCTGTGYPSVVAGVQNAACDTSISIGTSPATVGDLRFGASSNIAQFRSGGVNYAALASSGSTLYIGQDNAGANQANTVNIFPSTSFSIGVGAAPYISGASNVLTAAKPLAMGTGTVASTGDIRLGNTGGIYFDRTGSNIAGMWMDTGTSLGLGNANATNVTVYSGGAVILGAGATSVSIAGPVIGGLSMPYAGLNGTFSKTLTAAQTYVLAGVEYSMSSLEFVSNGANVVKLPAVTTANGTYFKYVQNVSGGGTITVQDANAVASGNTLTSGQGAWYRWSTASVKQVTAAMTVN